MRNPYLIEGPALISVSGGRTSGFMLRQIIDAHGGKLPPDVIPVFCNTGREHEATLRFLKELGERWTPIVWLEFRFVADDLHPEATFAIVDFCSASRQGERGGGGGSVSEHYRDKSKEDPDGDEVVCHCGHWMEWEGCDVCGGDGLREYMDAPEEWGEDCPSEANHLITCSECGGEGGWHYCPAAAAEGGGG